MMVVLPQSATMIAALCPTCVTTNTINTITQLVLSTFLHCFFKKDVLGVCGGQRNWVKIVFVKSFIKQTEKEGRNFFGFILS